MYKKIELKNNIRLITAPLHETATAALLVMVKVGSRQENEKNSGVSHFIEHIMFKGTTKRPDTMAISRELDGIGAEYNASTSKEVTGYYIKTNTKHLSLVIDVLSDMIMASKFDAEEIEREKGAIIEELNMYQDNPLMYVDDLLEQLMFDGHSLGRSIIGTKETVRGLARQDLVAYKDEFYHGSNVVIGLAGRFDGRHLKEVEQKFSFSGGIADKPQVININQTEPRIKLQYKETEQAQVALGFPGYSYLDPNYYALQVLSVILGGNMSSRLFITVREKNGLAYFVHSSLSVYGDTGGLVIQAGLDKTRIKEATALILSELEKIKGGVTAEELSRAKEYVAGKTALDLEDTAHLNYWYVNQELLTNNILTPEEKLNKIGAVTADDIKKVAQHVINFKQLNLAVIGPFKDRDLFQKIIG